MTITKITDHVDRALARLISQFRHSASHRNLLASYVAEVQEAENALFDILIQSSIADATGAQLDGLGQILGERRNGRGDSIYRQAIAARFFLNKSSGTIEEILHLFRLITDASPFVDEYFPAAFVLRLEELPVDDPVNLALMLRAVKVAAVKAVLHYLTATNNDTFALGTVGVAEKYLTATVSEGDDTIYLDSLSGIDVGMTLTLDPNNPAIKETVTVLELEPGSSSLFFNPMNNFSHAAGALVYHDGVPVTAGRGKGLSNETGTVPGGKLSGVI